MKTQNKIKNILLASVSTLCIGLASASAVESVVKVGAVIDVQGVHYTNNGDATQKKLSEYKKKSGLSSSGNLGIDYQLVSDSGMKYGAKIGLEQTAKNNRGTPLSIYVESGFGKLELGSDKSAGEKMKITGYKASCATGGGWDAFIIASPKDTTVDPATDSVAYATNFCSFLDSKARVSRKTDFSRKVTYFTPKFGKEDHQFQFGISYIPDTSNTGNDKIDANNTHSPVAASKYKFVIKDGVSYGATYEGKFNEELSAKLAFVGERGKPIPFSNDKKQAIKFKDLNSYVVGGEVTYNQMSVSASYMNYNKSLTNATIDTRGKNTGIYTAGVKYNFMDNKYSASLSHFHSDHKKNKVDATSLGLDYLIAQGIKAYAQVTCYKTKGFNMKKNLADKSKGTIMILGGKVSL